MNNRGQTLVLFVILIPALIFLFICFYQIGTIKIEEKRIKEGIKEALEYGVNNLESEILYTHIEEIIMSNDSDIKDSDIEIYIVGEGLNIKVKKEYETYILDDEVVLDYTGKKVNGRLEIIENRG